MDRVGDLLHVATGEDTKQLQAAVRQDLTLLAAGVDRCPKGALSDQARTEWNAMRDRANGFLMLEPSMWSATTQIAAGQAVLADLRSWHDRLKSCGVGPAPTDPSATSSAPGSPRGGGLFAGLSTEDMLKIGLVILAAYYGAKLFK